MIDYGDRSKIRLSVSPKDIFWLAVCLGDYKGSYSFPLRQELLTRLASTWIKKRLSDQWLPPASLEEVIKARHNSPVASVDENGTNAVTKDS
jgi:hypothetical protein